MKIYIDSDTFPASPALYADAEKNEAIAEDFACR